MKLAMYQMKNAGSMDLNLEKSLNAVKEAAENHADMILFPEVQLTEFFPQFESQDKSAYQITLDSPIVKAFQEGKSESEFFENSKTAAFGINVPKALGDFLVLKALYETDGTAVAVPDDEILDAVLSLAESEGTFVCPEGAALYAAAAKLKKSGFIKEEDRVVLLSTGAGIKYPDSVKREVPYLEKEDEI